jgi:hypothetical protein
LHVGCSSKSSHSESSDEDDDVDGERLLFLPLPPLSDELEAEDDERRFARLELFFFLFFVFFLLVFLCFFLDVFSGSVPDS